jgi:hypothetical protein
MAASRQCSPAKQSGEGHYDTSLPKLVADVQDQVAPIFEAGLRGRGGDEGSNDLRGVVTRFD